MYVDGFKIDQNLRLLFLFLHGARAETPMRVATKDQKDEKEKRREEVAGPVMIEQPEISLVTFYVGNELNS